jgi:uroporphyrinogen-III decarboxylase
MTHRERVVAALKRQPVDYVPCAPAFNPLLEVQRRGHRYQFPWPPDGTGQTEYLLDVLGVDPVVALPSGGIYPDGGMFPEGSVTSRVWMDKQILHKVFETPAGTLHCAVKANELWPFGRDIPFYHDFIAHYVEPWLKSEADLECLKHILLPPRTRKHLEELHASFAQTKALADKLQVASVARIGLGLTGAMQLCGAERICLMTVDQPGLVEGYLELEHRSNLRQMELALEWGADIIRRNGFYESADFYGPAMLERYLGKRLRAETRLVHQAGGLIGYWIHSGITPLLDYLATLGMDCIVTPNIDCRGVDLRAIKAKLGDKASFWAGPNMYHMWSPDAEVVRRAVREVFAVFGRTGLIISACSSAHSIMPWENTLAMIDEWKKLR